MPSTEPSPRGVLPLAGLALCVLACSRAEPGAAAARASAPNAPAEAGEAAEAQEGEPAGRWHRLTPEGELSPEQRRAIEELEAIGYASGSRPAAARTGVTLHDAARAQAGWNFYTSGHLPGAILMDMDGRERHRWQASVEAVWPDPASRGRTFPGASFWRRAHLYPNGDVLAIFEGHSLVKLDRDSRVLWKNRCGAHHDLEVLANGDILVLAREAHVLARLGEQPVLEDFVCVLGPDGQEKRRLSLLEALERSSFTELAAAALARRGDILHTNSLALLDGRLAERLPAFRAGNLLISSRPLSFIGVLDPERAELVWTLQGEFREQHDPKVLANGNLLLFDNGGPRGASSVLELDPVSGATVWAYRGSAAEPFFTRFCGTAERLANGNTLITESDRGHAFEVDPAGARVWEFWNPERAGPEGEFIASLFEVLRLAPQPPAWLK